MKIALLTFSSNVSCSGLRIMCALLKAQGHECSIYFFPLTQERREAFSDFNRLYPEDALNALETALADADVVGVSLMSNYIRHAVQVTRFLREHIPAVVVWGGPHCSAMPEQCLEYADYVCVGEGEAALADFVVAVERCKTPHDIPNIWTKRDGAIVRNPIRPFCDVDALPQPDLSFDHHVLAGDKIVGLTPELVYRHMGSAYRVFPTRGCPFRCTYCFNEKYNRQLYPGQNPFRYRSVENVIAELETARRYLPFVQSVCFDDDGFFALPIDYMREFAAEYRREIGLPFMVSGINPNLASEEKLAILYAAGLESVRMGIQTGSEKTRNSLYCRREANKTVLAAADRIGRYPIMPSYDFIRDNPWESEEDAADSVRMVARLKMPYTLNRFSLTFYPGTLLFDRAVAEGLVDRDWIADSTKHYNDVKNTRANRIFDLTDEFMLKPWMAELLVGETARKTGAAFVVYVFLLIVRPVWRLLRIRKHARRIMLGYRRALAADQLRVVEKAVALPSGSRWRRRVSHTPVRELFIDKITRGL